MEDKLQIKKGLLAQLIKQMDDSMLGKMKGSEEEMPEDETEEALEEGEGAGVLISVSSKDKSDSEEDPMLEKLRKLFSE